MTNSFHMFRLVFLAFALTSSLTVYSQTEILGNHTIIELTRAGLSVDLILKKIGSSQTSFDVSAQSLIELKRSGVDDGVIAFMMERKDEAPRTAAVIPKSPGFSESSPLSAPSRAPEV